MKRIVVAIGLAMSASAVLAADVGVSVTIGQPGFYGRIDIGNYGTPRLIHAEPVVVRRPPPGVALGRPLYLFVPPGHAKHWSKHCHRYDACGRQVYFVQESWYNDVVVPRHRGPQHGAAPGNGPGKSNGRGEGPGQGNGKGSGKGSGKGNGNGNGKGGDHGKGRKGD